jgi:G3E family GTPase
MPDKIILNIVSGFLGAGKTTFVQAMLQELTRRNEQLCQAEKIVYVVNEIGQVGIDAAILAGQSVLSYELTNGCICCSLKTEFSTMLQQIIDDQQPDRIIFEPSGLFVLSELFTALSGESYSEVLQIGSIVTLLDAQHQGTKTNMFSPLMQNQALLSDLLVVSKLQVQPNRSLDRLADLQLNFPGQTMLTRDVWDFTIADWQLVLDQKPRPLHQVRLNTARNMVRHQLLGTRQHPKLDTLSLTLILQVTRDEIQTRLAALTDGLYGDILRVKGFFRFDDCNWLVQMVCDQIDWHPVNQGMDQRLVIIGVNLQVDRINSLFQAKGWFRL